MAIPGLFASSIADYISTDKWSGIHHSWHHSISCDRDRVISGTHGVYVSIDDQRLIAGIPRWRHDSTVHAQVGFQGSVRRAHYMVCLNSNISKTVGGKIEIFLVCAYQ
jgi:hypothetical protein